MEEGEEEEELGWTSEDAADEDWGFIWLENRLSVPGNRERRTVTSPESEAV